MRFSFFKPSRVITFGADFFQKQTSALSNRLPLNQLSQAYASNFDSEVSRIDSFVVVDQAGHAFPIQNLGNLRDCPGLPDRIKYLLATCLLQTPSQETQGISITHEIYTALFNHYFAQGKLLNNNSFFGLVLRQTGAGTFTLQFTARPKIIPNPSVNAPALVQLNCFQHAIHQASKAFQDRCPALIQSCLLAATRLARDFLHASSSDTASSPVQIEATYFFEMQGDAAVGQPGPATVTHLQHAFSAQQELATDATTQLTKIATPTKPRTLSV